MRFHNPPAIQKEFGNMPHNVPLIGDHAPDSELPVHFTDLLNGPERRDEFLQELADTAGRAGIAGLAVGVVISFTGLVLLLRRRDDDFLDGIWELPSGAVETGETLVEAVARVVRKDTGLEIETVRCYLGSFDAAGGSGQQVRQYNFVAQVMPTDQITLTRHRAHTWGRPNVDQSFSAATRIILANFAAELTQ
jgi:8-oxo-dGTP diphosphatase